MRRAWWTPLSSWSGEPLLSHLDRHPAAGIREALPSSTASAWAQRVCAAQQVWVDDFGGEQHALGRAFYTHLETGRAAAYFDGAKDSDAVVERVVPGLQATTLGLLSRLIGGTVRRRYGFCGPGVHIFPASGKVARRGGVFHFDLEGLTPAQRAERPRALSFVWMLQPPVTRGGLTLFPRQWRGTNWPMDRTPKTSSTTTTSRAGDALLFSSYRLHRIQAFGGAVPRISITCHCVEVDRDVWDCWF
jgi:hypothetical protein